MIPVYQTIISPVNGNCLAACVASILEVSLDEVPQHIQDKNYFLDLSHYLESKGYEFSGDAWKGHPVYDHLILGRKYDNDRLICEGVFPGVNGFFIVSGQSPRFENCHHAVVWNKWGLVHDPVPGGRGVEPNSVKMIYKPEEWPLKEKYKDIFKD